MPPPDGQKPGTSGPPPLFKGSLWLSHLTPMENPDAFVGLDVVQVRLEEEMARLMQKAISNGMSPSDAKETSINIIVMQALQLQRQHAPASYRSMATVLVSDDPALEYARQVIRHRAARDEPSVSEGSAGGPGRQGFADGIRVGVAAAVAVAALWALLLV